MKFTLTGSLGHTNKPLAEHLLKAGHQVSVISSNQARAKEIEALGATAEIGSVEDEAFLEQAFTGADAVYTMIPPNFGAKDYVGYMVKIGKAYAKAIRAASVKRVVNLSSIGAHLPAGTGPIAGLHQVENLFQQLDGVAVKNLRAGFFYVNLYANIGMIKNAGILGSNYPATTPMKLVHPADIAAVAAEEIQKSFTGKSVQYVVSDERTSAELAKVLGDAIGNPGLPWVEFTDEQSTEGMQQAGLPKNIADMYTEMGVAVRSHILWEDYVAKKEAIAGKIKLEEFAKEFAAAYNAA